MLRQQTRAQEQLLPAWRGTSLASCSLALAPNQWAPVVIKLPGKPTYAQMAYCIHECPTCMFYLLLSDPTSIQAECLQVTTACLAPVTRAHGLHSQ